MKNTVRRLLAVMMVVAMVLTVSGSVFALEASDLTVDNALEAKKANTYDRSVIRNGRTFEASSAAVDEIAADQVVPIMVELKDAPAMEVYGQYTRSAQNYAATLRQKQDACVSKISKTLGINVDVNYNYTLLFNGFSFNGEYRLVEELNKMEGVRAFVAAEWDCPEIQLFNSGDMVGAINAWDLDYTGAGHIVAIIDTGCTVDHPAFSTDPEEVRFTQDDIADIIAGGELQGAGASAMNVNNVYYSAKIPFRWNYVHNNANVAHAYNDHGTHVAGIAAGNGGEIQGVAKDAQIAAMQVFKDSGGASWDNILPALEDCVVLGVDAANMSLGSPCGFTQYYDDSYAVVFQNLVNAGVNLAVSAGNEYSTALYNNWGPSGIGYALVENPDYGVTGSPSTWPESLGVASVDNSKSNGFYIENVATGVKFAYSETDYNQPKLAETFGGQTLDYVYIPGAGNAEDFEGYDVEGKVALIQRGTISFYVKIENAQAAGAIAVIIFNNTSGVINMNLQGGNITVPSVSIMQMYGESLAEAGEGQIFISAEEAMIDAPGGGEPSDFSSWGTTSDLRIKPEITAPGGNIYSSVDPAMESGELYQTWSGTSMAAPHVAGGMAIVTAYVEDMFPDASAAEKQGLVNAILMSTADPVRDSGGDFAAVRKQGAGLMDLASAVTTTAYLSVEGCVRPKLELGDDPERTGVFEMTFTVNNFGETPLTYTVEPHVLIEGITILGQYPTGPVIGYTQTSWEITEDCEIEMPEVVNVPAGESVDVTVVVDLGEDNIEFIEYYYTNGAYVEGFIELYGEGGTIGDVNGDGEVNSEDALLVMRYSMGIEELENLAAADVNGDGEVNMADALLLFRYAMNISNDCAIGEFEGGTDLNIPFLGFYGDWNAAPMWDWGFYYEDYPCNSNPLVNIVGGIYNSQYVFPLGLNPYVNTDDMTYYLDDRNAISPNGDGFLDQVDYISLGLLRNINDFAFELLDEDGNVLELLDYVDFNYRKDYYSTSSGQYSNFGRYLDPVDLSDYEGEDVYLRLYAGLSNNGDVTTNPFTPEANMFCEWIIPIHVDVIYPEAELVSVEDGTLVIAVTDDHYVAFAGALNASGNIIAGEGVFEEERGITTEIALEGVSEGDYVIVADYAGNEMYYVFDGESLIPDEVEPVNPPAPGGSSVNPLDYYEGFEDSSTYSGLALFDKDGDGLTWSLLNITGYESLGYDGTVAVWSRSWSSTDGVLTPDNLLATPEFVVGSGERWLSFFTSGSDSGYYQEHRAVYVLVGEGALDNAETWDELFANNVLEFTNETPNLTERLADLSAYAGQTVRIIFRHYNSTDVNNIIVDGIGVGPLK